MKTTDVTPTWGEWGRIFYALALCGVRKSVESLHPDLARAFAAAQALSELYAVLSPDQVTHANAVIIREMEKQGFTASGDKIAE